MDAVTPDVIAATLAEVEAERAAAGKLYRQFMSCGTLSVGLYKLAAGSEDPQQPHAEDEVYYIVSGRARLTAGDDDLAVAPGSTIFVAREVAAPVPFDRRRPLRPRLFRAGARAARLRRLRPAGDCRLTGDLRSLSLGKNWSRLAHRRMRRTLEDTNR